MRERFIRTKLPTRNIVVDDNTITVKATRYQQEGTAGKNTVILIPGWSMEGTSWGLRKMAKSFSREAESPVITISADFRKTSPQASQQQVQAIEEYLENLHIENRIIAGHSEGTTSALRLAKLYEQKGSEVSGIILMTPIGLTPYTPRQIATELRKAAFYYIPIDTIREIIAIRKNIGKFFDAGIIGLTMVKNIAKQAIRRGPSKYGQHVRQELINMTSPLENHFNAPVVIVLGENDNVVPVQKAITKAQDSIPNATIVKLRSYGHHGMPYQQHETIARRSIEIIRRARA